ncbi:arp2/3 complex-activating protein rickA-like [Xyrauchen texanus]|uniref:arp2/3 complex-activating protein rickA-like n=1 Tax=Xyrauchen texanus TaxID=154827 RepID=UPI002241BAC7|nr:arp2/3 complex-activating protein rickA-like [Xyrauchen texanus]XP_051975104.1 arp2/3 complex-activating protein rickA-like [Xyrauchen texanus]
MQTIFFGVPCKQHWCTLWTEKTKDAISKRFYWPGMSIDLDKWVAECVSCQTAKASIKEEVQFTPIHVTQPFELLGMDLIGKLSLTDSGHQYICVMIDYLTKWPQAYPLQSKSAEEVTNCIIKFFYQFEAPKRVLTDQGREFVNQINKNVSRILGIKRSLCSPYHPQTNGLVERMNGTIQRALCKLVSKKPKQWDKHLDAVMFGLRTKKQMTTKFSPFYMMFGREARYPSEVPEYYKIDNTVEAVMGIEEMTESVLKLDEVIQTALTHTAQVQKQMNKKDKKSQKIKFSVGDRVWRLNVRSQQRKGGKLDPDFLGPYTVKTIEGKSADLADERGFILKKINIDHMRLYIEETPRIPHKIVSGMSTATPASQNTSAASPANVLSPTTSASSVPSPTTAALSVPSPTTTASSVPSPTTAASSMPSPSTTALSVPSPTTTASSVPSPTTSASSVPSPTTTALSVPSPTTTALSVPSPTITASSVPTPTTTALSVPSPTTTASSVPSPTTTALSVPSHTTTASSVPSPTITASSVPTPTTTASSVPTPTTTASSVPSPSTTALSVPSPTTSDMAAISFTTAASVSSPTNSVASATPVHSVATLPSPTISATAQSLITLAKSVPSHFSLKAVVVSTTTTTATAVQDNLNNSTSATGLTVVNQCIQEAWSGKMSMCCCPELDHTKSSLQTLIKLLQIMSLKVRS